MSRKCRRSRSGMSIPSSIVAPGAGELRDRRRNWRIFAGTVHRAKIVHRGSTIVAPPAQRIDTDERPSAHRLIPPLPPDHGGLAPSMVAVTAPHSVPGHDATCRIGRSADGQPEVSDVRRQREPDRVSDHQPAPQWRADHLFLQEPQGMNGALTVARDDERSARIAFPELADRACNIAVRDVIGGVCVWRIAGDRLQGGLSIPRGEDTATAIEDARLETQHSLVHPVSRPTRRIEGRVADARIEVGRGMDEESGTCGCAVLDTP